MRLPPAILVAALAIGAALPTTAQARITSIDITKVEPAFGGQRFQRAVD